MNVQLKFVNFLFVRDFEAISNLFDTKAYIYSIYSYPKKNVLYIITYNYPSRTTSYYDIK